MGRAGKKFVTRHGPVVIAHRGFSGQFPENTLASIAAAIRLGVDFIEIDVHETRDGEIVVFHDFGLQRMCGVEARVCDVTLAEIVRLKPDVPTLKQVLKLCRRGGVRVLLEIKRADARKVAGIVESHGMSALTIVMSGSLRTLKMLATMYPKIARSALVRSDLAGAIRKFAGGPAIVAISVDRKFIRTRAEVAKIQSLRWKLFVWTVNREAEMRRLVSLGIDGLITNFPDRANALRRN